MRITSRGSVAKKRKEYAESVFCFDGKSYVCLFFHMLNRF